MVVGAAGDQVETCVHQAGCQSLCVLQDLLLVCLELGLESLAEGNSLSSDDVHQRAALGAGEDSLVDGLCQLSLAQDDAAAGTAQGLVGGGGDDVCIGHGVGMQTGSNQTGNVSHVNEQVCANLVSDLAELCEVDHTGICGSTGDDHLGLVLVSQLTDLVIVDVAVGVHTVGDHLIVQAGEVDGAAVGQVTAVVQVHAHDHIADVAQGLEDSVVCGSTGVGLNVCVVSTEQLLHAVDGDVLHHVHALAAAVVTLAGVTLSVLVGQDGGSCCQNGLADEVLGSDQLDVSALTIILSTDCVADLSVMLSQEIDSFFDHNTCSSNYVWFH